jgi:hypothetical protein
MGKIKNIATSYAKAIAPSQEEKEIADYRRSVCLSCPSIAKFRFGSVKYCKECGCLIEGKIYTNSKEDCPLKKWER